MAATERTRLSVKETALDDPGPDLEAIIPRAPSRSCRALQQARTLSSSASRTTTLLRQVGDALTADASMVSSPITGS